MWGKDWIALLQITENSCYNPPPMNLVGFRRTWKHSPTTPPSPHRIWSACGDDGKILLGAYYPHRIASASGDHGKDSRNSTSSTWQLCITVFSISLRAYCLLNAALICHPLSIRVGWGIAPMGGVKRAPLILANIELCGSIWRSNDSLQHTKDLSTDEDVLI